MFFSVSRFSKKSMLQRVPSLFLAFCLVMTGVLFSTCKMDGDGTPDLELNPDLIGTWKASGEGWTDTYTITEDTVSHPDDWGTGYANARIEFVYNFNEAKTAGGIIIKRSEAAFSEKPYIAVWFKNLNPKDQVLLGDAYDTTKTYPDTDASVATLDEAKSRFSPANAATYGGADAQMGTPLQWQ